VTDELDLNRLRGADELVLEEHSHCEVPAGCGGAVLRWASATSPCAVDAVVFGEATLAIDGARLDTRRLEIAPGTHVLTLEAQSSRPLLVTLSLPTRRSLESTLTTRADGSWRFTRVEPPASWTTLAFDASEWPALVAVPTPAPTERVDAWRVEMQVEGGAVALGTSEQGRLWVRRVFVLDREGLR
jgi:hypothetical protein